MSDRAAAAASDGRPESMDAIYEPCPTTDFSRAILERSAENLVISRLPDRIWNDWGTPERVFESLACAMLPLPAWLQGGWAARRPQPSSPSREPLSSLPRAKSGVIIYNKALTPKLRPWTVMLISAATSSASPVPTRRRRSAIRGPWRQSGDIPRRRLLL